MNKPIAFSLALLAAVSAQAQTNNFTGPSTTSWSTATNWSLGSVPTSAEDVFSTNATAVRITGGTAAQAGNLTIGGDTGASSTVQVIGNTGTNSLTVTGNITLAPGLTTGDLNLGFGGGSGATLTIGGGSGSILDGGGAGNSRIVIAGHMGTLGLANATADQLLINQITAGSLTIGVGQNYNILTTQGAQLGSATTNITTALTVDGTLVSPSISVGAVAANGTNNATFTLNTGGLVRTTNLRRTGSQTTTFDWNGGTIQNTTGANLMVQGTVSNTLTINLAQAGTRTFEADSGRTITISNTAVLADKSGENGSLTKTGAGSLVLLGTNTYSGATTVNAGTLVLATNGSLRFVIGGSGTNTAVLGTGTTAMNGAFAFDLTSAATNTNATWTVVAGTLTTTYGTNFLVTGFNGSGGNWTNTTNGVNYVFAQSSGVLSVQSTGGVTPYNAWVSYWTNVSPGFASAAAGTNNPDGDPFDNNEEFAFDGNPTVGSPALLTATMVGTNAVFNYVALTNTNAVTYTVQFTGNLSTGWTNSAVTVSNSINQTNINIPSSYVRKEFTVPASAAEFYRVKAAILP
jgi:hypothetical protein